jgi:hypothetical protein
MLGSSAQQETHYREVVIGMNPISNADTFLNFSGSDWTGFLKGSGLVTIVLGLCFLIIRYKFVELISIEKGTVAVRTSWGKPKFYNRRTSKLLILGVNNSDTFVQVVAWMMRYSWVARCLERMGRLVVLHPGPHKVFRGWQGLILVNLREIPLKLEKTEMTFISRTLWYQPNFVVQLDYADDRDGDRRILNSIYTVRDTDLHDQSIDNLRTKLEAMFGQSFSDVQPDTEADEQGFPKFQLDGVREVVTEQLHDRHGFNLKLMYIPPMAWTEAQIRRDGQVEAATIEATAKVQAANILANAIANGAQDVENGTSTRTHPATLVGAETLLNETG